MQQSEAVFHLRLPESGKDSLKIKAKDNNESQETDSSYRAAALFPLITYTIISKSVKAGKSLTPYPPNINNCYGPVDYAYRYGILEWPKNSIINAKQGMFYNVAYY